MVPKGKVIAYEPDKENFSQLQKNKEANNLNNLQVFPVAIQNNPKIKKISFNIRRTIDDEGKENRGLSSLVALPTFVQSRVTVSASTVDAEVERLKIKKINFIKIDVEGAELMVLKGAEKSIKRFKPIIQYEYSNVLDRLTKQKNAKKSFEFLKKLGYRQFAIPEEKGIKELLRPDSDISDVNVICFPPNKISLIKKLK